jgi:hypothetical protein
VGWILQLVDKDTGETVSGAGPDTQFLPIEDGGGAVLQRGEVVLQKGARERMIKQAGVDPLAYNIGSNANKPRKINILILQYIILLEVLLNILILQYIILLEVLLNILILQYIILLEVLLNILILQYIILLEVLLNILILQYIILLEVLLNILILQYTIHIMWG